MNITPESLRPFLYSLTALSALIAAFFSVKLFLRVRQEKQNPLGQAFILFTIGVTLSALAELIWDISFSIFKFDPETLLAPDLLWVAGEFLVFIGLFYFLMTLLQREDKLPQGVLFLLVLGSIFSSLIYFIVHSTIDPTQSSSPFSVFLTYYYPLISVLMLVETFLLYPYFRSYHHIQLSFFLFGLSILSLFLGDMFYLYSTLRESFGISGILSEVLYVADYSLKTAAFYLALKTKEYFK